METGRSVCTAPGQLLHSQGRRIADGGLTSCDRHACLATPLGKKSFCAKTAGVIDALTNLLDAEVVDLGNPKIWCTTIFWKRYNFISPRCPDP